MSRMRDLADEASQEDKKITRLQVDQLLAQYLK